MILARRLSSEKALLPLGAAAIAVWSVSGLWDADVWWHMAYGRWIWEHLAVPRADPFVPPLTDRPWVDFEWFFELLLYGAYRLGKIPAVLDLKAALLALSAGAFWLSLGAARPVLKLAALLLVFWQAWPRNMARPELVSMVILPLFLRGILEVDKGGGKRWFLILPALSVIWANTHGAFLWNGAALLAIAAAAKAASGRHPPLKNPFFWLGALCAGAGLLNPYGHKIYSVTFGMVLEALEARPTLTEFVPIGLDEHAGFWLLLGAAWWAVVSACRRERRIDALALGWMALATWLGARFVRNVPVALMIAAAAAFRGLPRESPAASRTRWEAPAAAVLCALLILAGISRSRWGVDPARYPVEAAAFALKERPQGRLYNDYNLGSYLVWAFYGTGPSAFLYGRMESGSAWPQAHRARSLSPESLPAWKDLLARFDISWCMMEVPKHRIFHNGRPVSVFAYYFPADQWALVYRDAKAAIYVRRGGPNASLIARRELRGVHPDIDGGEPLELPWEALFVEPGRS